MTAECVDREPQATDRYAMTGEALVARILTEQPHRQPLSMVLPVFTTGWQQPDYRRDLSKAIREHGAIIVMPTFAMTTYDIAELEYVLSGDHSSGHTSTKSLSLFQLDEIAIGPSSSPILPDLEARREVIDALLSGSEQAVGDGSCTLALLSAPYLFTDGE